MFYGEVEVSDLTTTRVVVLSEDSGLLVGFCTFDEKKKTIELVRVNDSFRRRGYGSALIRIADSMAGCILKDTGERSEEGTKLLKSMGRKPVRIKYKINGESAGAMMMSQMLGKACNGSLEFKFKKPFPETIKV